MGIVNNKEPAMIEKAVEFKVYPDPEYHYAVAADLSSLTVTYFEKNEVRQTVSFGSVEEMEAVAQAMLLAVKTFNEINKE